MTNQSTILDLQTLIHNKNPSDWLHLMSHYPNSHLMKGFEFKLRSDSLITSI